jgi:DtxR family transcriptional regulator, Mn-dependent transcriptional regulator
MSDRIELDEYLEVLYHLWERDQVQAVSPEDYRNALEPPALRRLTELGLLSNAGSGLQLTDAGFSRAQRIVRSHRLAERLLADVLHMDADAVEKGACEFEHVLAEEITESICILLGHPRTCPHGSSIPLGDCCRRQAHVCASAAVALREMPVGTWGRVAFVCSAAGERTHRLAHLGIVPGARIKVHQTKPFVVTLDSVRVAMEEAIARDVFVWTGAGRRLQSDPSFSVEDEP